jgi:hypothetical protein
MTKPYIRLLYLIIVLMLICTIEVRVAPALPKHRVILLNLCQASLHRSDEKVIERDPSPNEPVEIDNLAVKNVKIALHQKFSAKSVAEQGGGQEEDWLENLEFIIKNKSDKRIIYLSISLGFTRLGNTDTSVGTFYNFALGVDLRASGDAATYVEPFSLAAGGSHTVRLSGKDLKEIKSRLAMSKSSLAEVNRVILRIPTVGYEDGVQWQLGNYLIPEKVRRSDKKVVEKMGYDNEPYEIGNLSVKNITITSRERLVSNGFMKVRRDSYEFSAKSAAKSSGEQEEEWLEELQLTLKNKSDKQITYIGLSIQFPETEVNGPMMVYNQLGLGIHPKASAERVKQSTPLVLVPGDTVTFTLSAQQLKLIKDFLALRKFQLAGLNKVAINIETVIHEDGIMWSAGHYYKPNSSAPGGYERIDQ